MEVEMRLPRKLLCSKVLCKYQPGVSGKQMVLIHFKENQKIHALQFIMLSLTGVRPGFWIRVYKNDVLAKLLLE